jgi:Kef-type K+ transport system membrane component KefB
MKKYLSIFNIQTLIVFLVCLISCYISLTFRLSIFIDFLILGIIIAFPLTFSLRVAFRRRERALQYLSLFKASLQSVVYAFGNSKLDETSKTEIKSIANDITDQLIDYLLRNKHDAAAVQKASHAIYTFVQVNRENLKSTFSAKVLLFIFRINESIEFLLATRRHNIPWGPKAIVLFAIYVFAVFYPASLLHKTGFNVPFWYVLTMTSAKSLFLISFYNIQKMLEDPFNQNSPDGIRLYDFQFVYQPEPVVAIMPKKNDEEKKKKQSNEVVEEAEENDE